MCTIVGSTQLCVICLQHIVAHLGHYHWVHFGSVEGLHVWLQKQYSRIPFIQHPWDWMDAGVSNIVDYWMVHILIQVLTSSFLLLRVYLGSTRGQRSNPFGSVLQLKVQGHQGPFLCFLELLQFVRDAEWPRRMWIKSVPVCRSCWSRRQDTLMVNVCILMGAFFEHVPEICFSCLSIRVSGG